MQLSVNVEEGGRCDPPRDCVKVIECEARFFREADLKGYAVRDVLFVGTSGVATRSEIQKRRWNSETQEFDLDGWASPRWARAIECSEIARENMTVSLKRIDKAFAGPSPVPIE